ncbi:DUF2637 domain-containing protein [Streptomyces xanthochromogenes]|uniref:Membrane protein n=1 Tax=Streptomyces xanthochromogenes TaxID=67384 RepID=A0ABQ3ASC8_9ACTN|nr:DUF2637 domain-containing protein [Streptomyces xanthochromogenes]GGY66288.1 membrane protein [Streptomyces xanthochromogenes]
MAATQLTRTHRILIGVVVAGAVVIAGIGFAGSYAAVRELALQKGFGNFSYVFPIGVDAGICVLLALDLLLTWMRIPFPLLRQTAWLLTAATIAFNGAAAWPDPLGVGMHAVIPVLFVVSVEAARHAVGRIADITADKHMEGVRLTRWLLSPIPTFRLWRRMKLWELRSYEQVIKLEQDRLVYRARLQAVYGRAWRRKAPIESLMPLRLAKFGVPLAETAPAGLAAAGMEPVLLPPAPPAPRSEPQPELPPAHAHTPPEEPPLQTQVPAQAPPPSQAQGQSPSTDQAAQPEQEQPYAGPEQPTTHESPWFAAQHLSPEEYAGTYDPAFAEAGPQEPQPPQPEPDHALEHEPVMVPSGPGRERPLGVPGPRAAEQEPVAEPAPTQDEFDRFAELAYEVFRQHERSEGDYPTVETLDIKLTDEHGVRYPDSTAVLRTLHPQFKKHFEAQAVQARAAEDHIA